MSSEETVESGKSFLVGKKEDLMAAKRSSVTVCDRVLLIVHHQESFYALDQHCYHAGSSLLNGDIEELDNILCIVCPKHKYRISLRDGEGIYNATNPKEKEKPPCWKSKGVRQRVHKVTEADGNVFVTLSETPGWIESDYYQSEQGRADIKLAMELEANKADKS